MNKDEEQRFTQLSDSQIRDSLDALFCLAPDQQNQGAATTTEELPFIQMNPSIENCQIEATRSVMGNPITTPTTASTTSTVPLMSNPALFNTSQRSTPPMTSLPNVLPHLGFMPNAPTYNPPDVFALLANANASSLPTVGFSMPMAATTPTTSSTTTERTILPTPQPQEPKAFSSRKRKAPSIDTAASIHLQKTPMICSEDESEQNHRRMGRNAREQHRAQQITLQIAALRDLLMKTSNLQFKPDKFSTLLTAAQYIRQLQKKQQTLAAEHQSLLRTLQKTSETLQRTTTGDNEHETVDQLSETFIHQGIPYRVLFQMCPAPMCLVRMDGRFLDANAMLEQLLGTKVDSLKDEGTTFFNVLDRSSIENIFCAMSRLLEVPLSLISSDLTEAAATSGSSSVPTDDDHEPSSASATATSVKSTVSSINSSSSSNGSSDDDSLEQNANDSFTRDVILAHTAQKVRKDTFAVRSSLTLCTGILENHHCAVRTNANPTILCLYIFRCGIVVGNQCCFLNTHADIHTDQWISRRLST